MLGRPPKSPKVERTCEQCGKTWQSYSWDIANKTKYCSRECFYASRVGRSRETDLIPEQRPCARCGKIFLVGGEGNKKTNAKYCSRTCAKHGYWGDALHKSARQMTDAEAAWLAGFFDGEGCVRWPRRTIIKSVAMTITNTNEEIMQKVTQITGTGRTIGKPPKNPRHSYAWTWQCYGDNARTLLRQILPWLIIKREAAKVALGIEEVKEAPWTQRTLTMRKALE